MDGFAGLSVLVRSSTVVVLLLASVSCGDDGDEVRILTAEQSGAEIEFGSEEEFEVHLESNPSTGFMWEISEMTTPDLVQLVSRRYVEADSDLVGVAGTEVFVFSTGEKGAGVLRLEYVRSFDDPIVPERVAEYVVRIDGAQWPPPDGTAAPPSTAEVSD